MGVGDVKSLIAEGTLDPELLEALLEADRLDHIAKRAQIDASNRNHDDGDTAGDTTVSSAQEHVQNDLVNEVGLVNEGVTDEFAAGRDDDGTMNSVAAGGVRDGHGDNDDNGGANSSSRFSKNGAGDMARVIDVNENKVEGVSSTRIIPSHATISSSQLYFLICFLHFSIPSFFNILSLYHCLYSTIPPRLFSFTTLYLHFTISSYHHFRVVLPCMSPGWAFVRSFSLLSTMAKPHNRPSSTTVLVMRCRRL